jgi:hypothetical protein
MKYSQIARYFHENLAIRLNIVRISHVRGDITPYLLTRCKYFKKMSIIYLSASLHGYRDAPFLHVAHFSKLLIKIKVEAVPPRSNPPLIND